MYPGLASNTQSFLQSVTGWNYRHVTLYLPRSFSLKICTAFSDVFKTSGYLGMYIFYLVETAVVIFIILLFNKIIQYRVCAYVSVAYFYLLSFFSNPVIYDITALILIFLIIFRALLNFKNFKQVRCLGVKKIFKEWAICYGR